MKEEKKDEIKEGKKKRRRRCFWSEVCDGERKRIKEERVEEEKTRHRILDDEKRIWEEKAKSALGKIRRKEEHVHHPLQQKREREKASAKREREKER